jgi:SAM-dependent methyltransferase
MSFDVTADAYGRFMGRFSEPLGERFVRVVGVHAGQRALDVGCGAGALTALLVDELGPGSVSAVDPSASFVSAVGGRFPDADVRLASAESLPYDDACFDVTLAQLVVHFMTDPHQGLREMARVTRPGGTVAASVWDHAGGRGPLAVFWRAAGEQDPSTPDESHLAGVREGDLALLFMAAGMAGATSTSLEVVVEHADFDAWWDPFTLGVGPAGAHVASLDPAQRDDLRERCRALLPEGPFTTSALAWTVVWTDATD